MDFFGGKIFIDGLTFAAITFPRERTCGLWYTVLGVVRITCKEAHLQCAIRVELNNLLRQEEIADFRELLPQFYVEFASRAQFEDLCV